MLPGELGVPEYPSIPFLPGFLEDKTLEQFPYTVENGWLESQFSQFFDGGVDAIPLTIQGVHDWCTLIPNMGGEGENVKEIIYCFCLLPTQRKNGLSNEPHFGKVVPGKIAFMRDQPKEDVDFWPVL